MKRFVSGLLLLSSVAGLAQLGCNDNRSTPALASPTPVATPAASPTPVVTIRELPITLPLLDALFFVDRRFSDRLKSDLQLSDEQVAQIRQTVRTETSRLRESMFTDETGRTKAAGVRATEQLTTIIGADKTERLAQLALERWRAASEGVEEPGAIPLASPQLTATLDPRGVASPSPEGAKTAPVPTAPLPSAPYAAPTDTRVVVNAPAYRMDIFSNGQLIKSYKVAIGYPEFPLPTGMRKASSIIFNPTWTPPDEPWVESSNKVKVGQKVAAGDKLNPLGPIKIPIGLPSLIHGGKSPARIGTFASHGCVGMTNKQVQSFSQMLARLGGVELTPEEVARHQKTPTETKSVKLKNTVPVELRYETIVLEDGKLHIYRDVYDRGTNVQENLQTALATNGLDASDLTEAENAEVMMALELLGGGAAKKNSTAAGAQKADQRQRKLLRDRLARQLKGKKEIVIEIAALGGKGYPAPVELDTGLPPKPTTTPVPKKRR